MPSCCSSVHMFTSRLCCSSSSSFLDHSKQKARAGTERGTAKKMQNRSGSAGHTRTGRLSLLFATALLGLPSAFALPSASTSLSRRDILSDLISFLPSNLQDDATQGVLQNWWMGIPKDENAIKKAFGVNDLDSLNATLEFLNIPYVSPFPLSSLLNHF